MKNLLAPVTLFVVLLSQPGTSQTTDHPHPPAKEPRAFIGGRPLAGPPTFEVEGDRLTLNGSPVWLLPTNSPHQRALVLPQA
jgi:hypothetical protein